MHPLTTEWIAKAEEDLAVARREAARTEEPAFNAVCFHAQKAAEKFIEAVLQQRGEPVPRVHNLPVLAKLVEPGGDAFDPLRGALAALSQLSVTARYPGYFANKRAAVEALGTAERVRTVCRGLLNLPLT